jgi:large subunit ribosomal protein L3
MKGILGKKLGMTQIFAEDGRLFSVTVLEAGPAKVVQKKEKDRDGYESVQLGFDEVRKEKNIKKPMVGHFKKSSVPAYRFLREIRMKGLNSGDEVTVDIFRRGERISIAGTSKGKGFQGVIKRHNFSGGPGSHGSMFNREPGSLGQSASPSRVFKNTRLPGHMGSEKVTVKNIEIVDIKKDQNLILVKGAVPGAKGSYIVIQSDAPVAVEKADA